jgi:hypothetical protein
VHFRRRRQWKLAPKGIDASRERREAMSLLKCLYVQKLEVYVDGSAGLLALRVNACHKNSYAKAERKSNALSEAFVVTTGVKHSSTLLVLITYVIFARVITFLTNGQKGHTVIKISLRLRVKINEIALRLLLTTYDLSSLACANTS